MEPLGLVIRYGDGTWSFLCNTTADAQYLVSVHTAEVFARFENDLRTLRDLPPGFLAERDGYGHEWQLERDSEHY